MKASQIALVLVILNSSIVLLKAQEPCILSFLLMNLEDNHQVGVEIGHADCIGNVEDGITLENTGNPDFDLSSTFTFEVIRTGNNENSTVRVLAGVSFKDYMDLDPRSTDTIAKPIYTCNGNPPPNDVRVDFTAGWIDTNSRVPEWDDPSDISFNIQTNWDKTVPLNWNNQFLVYDEDYNVTNAGPVLTEEDPPGFFRFQFTRVEGDGNSRRHEFTTLIFIADGVNLTPGQHEIEVRLKDDNLGNGFSQIKKISLNIEEESGFSPPKFEEILYKATFSQWPEPNVPVEFEPDIAASTDDGASITYTLLDPSLTLTLTNNTDPNTIVIASQPDPFTGPTIVIAKLQATNMGNNFMSEVPLVIEFPPKLEKPVPVFTTSFSNGHAEWGQIEVETEIALEGRPETPSFFIGQVYPAELQQNITVEEREEDGKVVLTLLDIKEHNTDIQNGVIMVEVIARFGEDGENRKASTTFGIYFPAEEMPTTTEMNCPTTTSEDCTCPEPTTCPTDPTCPTEGPPTTCPECPTETPPTTCPEPTTCSTDPSCPTETPPTTCPDPECPTDPSCPTETPPTTCPDPECPTDPSCPTETPPTTCPDPECPTDPSCPTETPPTTCPDPECPTETTSSSTCPPCPTTETPPTSETTCSTDPSCPEPTPCTTITPPTTTTCPSCPECPTTTTTCPTDPSCPECPTTTPRDCDCSTTPGTTSNTTTSTSTPTTQKPCEECSTTGLVAGIAATSVLMVAAIGVAGFLYWKLKTSAVVVSSTVFGGGSSYPPKHSFAQPPSLRGGRDLVSSELNNSSNGLEQVLTHPEASNPNVTSGGLASPYMIAPIAESDYAPMKSSLAKPKEIAPDYEEGLNLGQNSKAESSSSKPKSAGVKIADEVEIISTENDQDALILDSDSERL